MATGVAKLACCQPVADSLVNVTVLSRVPVLVHRWPTCVPVLAAPLKNRKPVTVPATSDRNFTPSSIDRLSFSEAKAGTVEASQIVAPTMALVVLKVHEY